MTRALAVRPLLTQGVCTMLSMRCAPILLYGILLVWVATGGFLRAETLSSIRPGDAASESAHAVRAEDAPVVEQVFESAAGEARVSGRRPSPPDPAKPAAIQFEADVLPSGQNYLTLKVWGGGKDWFPLNLLDPATGKDYGNIWWHVTSEPPLPGRWIYRTFPIPKEITEGKKRVSLRLQTASSLPSPGAFRNPGDPKPPEVQRPTFAIHGIYTHTEPCFEVPAEEVQGKPFVWGPPPREKPADYPSIEERLLERARNDIEYTLKQDVNRSIYDAGHRKLTRMLDAMGLIYNTKWSGHYHDESIATRMRDAIDTHVKRQAAEGGDPGKMFYRAWGSHGRVAHAYSQMHGVFEKNGWLDEPFEMKTPEGNVTKTRRQAYADFFHDAFEWRRSDRRHYTNQPLYVSHTLYRLQTALRQLGDPRALSEKQALWYVREAMGLVPLRSREFAIEAEAANYPWFNITQKGLTREIGYVDAYGELIDSMLPVVEDTGSPEVKAQTSKALAARAMVRIPDNDADGNRILRGIGFMSWRKPTYPFRICYSGINEVAVLGDPVALRLAQLEIEHGRPYLLPAEPERGPHWDPAKTMKEYEYYLKVRDLPPSPYRLAMEPDQGDMVWSDEENGVFSFRHGDDRVYGSFFMPQEPAGRAVGDFAAVQFTKPDHEFLVDMIAENESPESGLSLTVDTPAGPRTFPQTPLPPGMKAWQELPPNSIDRRAGRAYFYRMKFGDYLIGMNTTEKGSYRESIYKLDIPDGFKSATDVATGKEIDTSKPVEVGPQSTKVLYLGKEKS